MFDEGGGRQGRHFVVLAGSLWCSQAIVIPVRCSVVHTVVIAGRCGTFWQGQVSPAVRRSKAHCGFSEARCGAGKVLWCSRRVAAKGTGASQRAGAEAQRCDGKAEQRP